MEKDSGGLMRKGVILFLGGKCLPCPLTLLSEPTSAGIGGRLYSGTQTRTPIIKSLLKGSSRKWQRHMKCYLTVRARAQPGQHPSSPLCAPWHSFPKLCFCHSSSFSNLALKCPPPTGTLGLFSYFFALVQMRTYYMQSTFYSPPNPLCSVSAPRIW